MKKLTQLEALELIEMMVFDVDENMSIRKLMRITGEIYEIAHAHNKNHSCYKVHTSWRDDAVKQFPEFKKALGRK